jgi:DNA-binding transcriptional LysR family regulator
MNLGAFDLNLLIVFDAVMQERSVTRAGDKIGLSQPAMSHALNRLRYMLKDQLFIRTPEGMVPTPRAEQLAEPLRRALSDMQLALEPETFLPKEAQRSFAIAVNNYAAVVLTPAIIAAAADAAPFIKLDIRPSGTLDVLGLLDRGELDLAIGYFPSPGERFGMSTLLEDRFVVAMRHDHPSARQKFSANAFAALLHLDISSSGEDTSFIDRWLESQKLSRRIAHCAPYLSAAHVLAQSNMVATLSLQIAKAYVRSAELQIGEFPFKSPRVELAMLWHRRLESQPAHRWLRAMIEKVAKRL